MGRQEEALLDEPALGHPVHDDPNHVIWEGSTWDVCPTLLMPCAALCCVQRYWRITRTRIDVTHGCCGSSCDSVEMRSIIDLHYHTSLTSFLAGRGTITIHSENDHYPELSLSTFGARQLFEELKEAWSNTRRDLTAASGFG